LYVIRYVLPYKLLIGQTLLKAFEEMYLKTLNYLDESQGLKSFF